MEYGRKIRCANWGSFLWNGGSIRDTSPFENKGRISFAAFFENDDDGSDDRSLFIKGRYILAIILNIISREPDKYSKRYDFL